MLNSNSRLYGPIKLIFFVKFRDVDYDVKMNLLQFLAPGDTIPRTDREQKLILEKVEKLKENVFIVMDGFDEATIGKSFNRNVYGIEAHDKAEVFIASLIRGYLLPHAKKIITSRPRQLSRLLEDFSSYFIVNIHGLNSNGQEQICKDICGKDFILMENILKFIKAHPDLKSFCYVPINAILAMKVLFETKTSEWSNLSSLTAIVVTALNVWFLQDGKVLFQAKELARLASIGIEENRYYFESDDLKDAGINFQNLTTFLICYSNFQLLEGTETISYFAHLVWQEFFVAVMLRLYTNKQDFEKAVLKLDSDKYEVVARFLFGFAMIAQ